MYAIELKSLCKSFGPLRVLDALSLCVAPGTLALLRGPSGCGKTTLLRLVAGLESPEGGEIFVQGQRVCGAGVFVPPHRRGLAMSFQDFALWPHLSVEGHLDFVLRAAGTPRATRQNRIDEMLETVELTEKRHCQPGVLSGGQQQRLNLARAMAADARVLLLDEPLAHLDARLQTRILEALLRCKARGTAILMAAHDCELDAADACIDIPRGAQDTTNP